MFPNLVRSSRSSSTETVRANSESPTDHPLTKIAGKIANVPENRFRAGALGSMDEPCPKKDGKGRRVGTHLWDTARAEQQVDRMLEPIQDYKDVSEFFSKRAGTRTRAPQTVAKVVGVCNLSRRVTNPLYKEYDPAGYTKTEDELATECIHAICTDFNNWVQSLADDRDQQGTGKGKLGEAHTAPQKSLEIGPEFLIRILRTELELPPNHK